MRRSAPCWTALPRQSAMSEALQITRLDSGDADFEARLAQLLDRAPEADPQVTAQVAAIIAAVHARGDAALLEYTNRFDRRSVSDAAALEVGPAEREAAWNSLP